MKSISLTDLHPQNEWMNDNPELVIPVATPHATAHRGTT